MSLLEKVKALFILLLPFVLAILFFFLMDYPAKASSLKFHKIMGLNTYLAWGSFLIGGVYFLSLFIVWKYFFKKEKDLIIRVLKLERICPYLAIFACLVFQGVGAGTSTYYAWANGIRDIEKVLSKIENEKVTRKFKKAETISQAQGEEVQKYIKDLGLKWQFLKEKIPTKVDIKNKGPNTLI